jgi:ATP-binding cassette subfamily C (CFTR/MRP) protein 4
MIAHRLETAVTFTEKILVLDKSKLVEFDHPYKLLAKSIDDTDITNTDSIFSQMVLSLNQSQQERIFNKAKKRYSN